MISGGLSRGSAVCFFQKCCETNFVSQWIVETFKSCPIIEILWQVLLEKFEQAPVDESIVKSHCLVISQKFLNIDHLKMRLLFCNFHFYPTIRLLQNSERSQICIFVVRQTLFRRRLEVLDGVGRLVDSCNKHGLGLILLNDRNRDSV